MKPSAASFKQIISSSFLGLTLCLLSLPAEALTVKEVPNPRRVAGNWVTDKAEILKPETEVRLNQMINQLEKKNGAEIAVVTVPETQPSTSPKAFATELFNYWHIGKKGRDNGVLFLISKSDRRVEIETGYGVEASLPDAKVGTIIDTEVLPRFKQSEFDGGTLAGTRSVVITLEPSLAQDLPIPIEQVQPSRNRDDQGGDSSAFFLMVVIVSLGMGFYNLCRWYFSIGRAGEDDSSYGGSGGSSSGSSSSGGSGGFGGGSSGGGGSGGSW